MEISEINPDGNVYQIKDATARTQIADLAAKGDYSTTEIDTGKKWIDGKTIYRKSGERGGVAANLEVTLDSSLTTSVVDTVVSVSLSEKGTSGNIIFGAGFVPGNVHRVSAIIKSEGFNLLASTDACSGVYWTIEYTKK